MLSEAEEKSLLDICELFIKSGDDVNLVHLLDQVNSTIPDQQSQEWKSWTKHMEQLNKAWVMIMKEDQNMAWLEVWFLYSTYSALAIHSAPTIMDLLNTENVELSEVDIEAIEDRLFNHPDPYDLDKTDYVDEALQVRVIRSSTHLNIADYVKLDDPDLKALIMKVDSAGPGVSVPAQGTAESSKTVGKPGEWSIKSFLGGACQSLKFMHDIIQCH